MSETRPVDLAASPGDAMNYLRTRSLYLATPAYGGWLGVNYIQSLMGLYDMCHDIGIKYRTVSFLYNESLITRARNQMVDKFMKETNFTDFFFIDADIGFDPRDVISLMLHTEEVVGAPCVRKTLRWDRIQRVIHKNSKDYSGEELERIAGEFVLNFPPENPPEKINIGEMLEVQDVGTGLMRIKREVFIKLQQTFPDRWYIPMTGEIGNQVPMYMFFQAGLDWDMRKYNRFDLPMYIPEDYAFCREVRRAGMKVWLAPWMKTTHMGTYVYQGDMLAVAQSGEGLGTGQLRNSVPEGVKQQEGELRE